ncbi:MAG: sigma-70 family RNA polymerase sigma factor [Planctomycetaceae bacterium]
MGEDPDEIRRWVRAARTGDRTAFEALYRRLEETLRRESVSWASVAGQEGSLNDVLQNAWVRALGAFRDFEGDNSSDENMLRSLRAWLRRVVASTAKNMARDGNRLKRRAAIVAPRSEDPSVSEIADNDATPSKKVSRDELIQRLITACEQVPDVRLREILKAKLAGISNAQFGREHQIKEHEVRALQADAIRFLRKELPDELGATES